MRDDNTRTTIHQVIHPLLDEFFGDGIDRTGCLIHDERGGTLGLDESRSLVAGLLNCFPDYALDCRTLIAEGDKVVAEYMARGTLQRDFMGIPARGQQFEVPAAEIYRIENGKVVETWWFQDSSLMEKQLRSQ